MVVGGRAFPQKKNEKGTAPKNKNTRILLAAGRFSFYLLNTHPKGGEGRVD